MRAKRNIQQRGSAFLVDVSKNGKRQRVTCGSLEEAQSVRAKLELTTAAMLTDQWTLDVAFKTCYDKVWANGLNAPHCFRNGQAAVSFFGAATRLNAITTEWVDAWIARLQQMGNSNATVNRKLATLSKILSFAHRRNKVSHQPHFERQTESEGRIRFLTQEEESRALAFLNSAGKDDHAEAFCVLVDTGIRPSELWRLEGRDCNLETHVLTIWLAKNGESRSVPMTQRVQEIISRRMDCAKTGPLFPFDNFWMLHVWDKMKAYMGLSADKQFIPYALRHTCASRLVQRRVPIRVVQAWMGHKTLQMTVRYGHLSPENLFDAVKVLEAC